MSLELSCCMDVDEPSFSDVTSAVVKLMGFLRDHGVTDSEFLQQFELATAEALNNAVEHAADAGGKKFFRARVYIRPEFVEMRVVDPSSFEGWSKPPKLPEDPFAEGGRGHYLMSQLTDELVHEDENGCHMLVLRKWFTTGKWEYVAGHSDQVLLEMTDELVASYEMISTLLGLSEWLATSPEIDAFSAGALSRLCEVTGASFSYVRFEDRGNLVLLKQSGMARRPPAESIRVDGPGVEAEVFRTGHEVTLPAGTVYAPDDPLEGVMDTGFVTPILFKDQRRGILVMGHTMFAPFFDAGKLKIARLLCDYLGIVVAMAGLQKRRLAEERALHDLKIAAQIQLSLMPKDFSPRKGLDFFGACLPARQAGGDCFDIVVLPDESVLCLVADVMGKGLPAALLATMLRTNLRGIVAGGVTEPGEVLTRINRLMIADLMQLEMYITMGCIWISPSRDVIRNASAGHLRPLLLHGDRPGEVTELLDGGMPVGIFPDASYVSQESPFSPGSRLLLYTDGLIEASAPDGTFFTAERVAESLRRTYALCTRDALMNLLEEISSFTVDAELSDDRTAVLLTRTS